MITEGRSLLQRSTGEGWQLSPRRSSVTRVVGALVGVAIAAAGGVSLGAGGLLPGLLLVAGGLALGWVTWSLNTPGRRIPPRITQTGAGDHGLFVPTQPNSPLQVIAFAVLGLLFLAGAGVLLYAVLTDSRWLNLVGVVVCLAFGVVFLVGAWAALRSRAAGPPGIVIGTQAVELRNRREAVSVPWDDITAVRAHWSGGARRGSMNSVENWLTLELTHPPTGTGTTPRRKDALAAVSGTPYPTVAVRELAVDPERLLEALRFYLANPSARVELAGQAAVSRVADGTVEQ